MIKKVSAIFDRILNAMAFIAALLLVLIMLGVVTEVLLRFFFNKPIFWMIEVIECALLYITFLGGAWLLARDKHVTMDFVLNRVNPKTKAILNIITSFLCMIVFLILTWYTGKEAWSLFKTGAVTETRLGQPKFTIFGIIPLGSFFLMLQFIRRQFGFLKTWEKQ